MDIIDMKEPGFLIAHANETSVLHKIITTCIEQGAHRQVEWKVAKIDRHLALHVEIGHDVKVVRAGKKSERLFDRHAFRLKTEKIGFHRSRHTRHRTVRRRRCFNPGFLRQSGAGERQHGDAAHKKGKPDE
jgi:hypothetical protein